MERLTIHNGMYKRLNPEQAEAIYKKLRAYEDTGLEPEQCAKYAQAEKEGRYIVLKEPRSAGVHRLEEIARADIEGRLVVLPCKVGDTVYKPLGKNEEILPITIQWFETNNYGWCACGTYPPRATYALRFADLGKTWFTDRAEAEKAMEVSEDA